MRSKVSEPDNNVDSDVSSPSGSRTMQVTEKRIQGQFLVLAEPSDTYLVAGFRVATRVFTFFSTEARNRLGCPKMATWRFSRLPYAQYNNGLEISQGATSSQVYDSEPRQSTHATCDRSLRPRLSWQVAAQEILTRSLGICMTYMPSKGARCRLSSSTNCAHPERLQKPRGSEALLRVRWLPRAKTRRARRSKPNAVLVTGACCASHLVYVHHEHLLAP